MILPVTCLSDASSASEYPSGALSFQWGMLWIGAMHCYAEAGGRSSQQAYQMEVWLNSGCCQRLLLQPNSQFCSCSFRHVSISVEQGIGSTVASHFLLLQSLNYHLFQLNKAFSKREIPAMRVPFDFHVEDGWQNQLSFHLLGYLGWSVAFTDIHCPALRKKRTCSVAGGIVLFVLGFVVGRLPHYLESQRRFVEPSGVGADLVFDVTRIFSVQSKYQKIDVLRSNFFGHILTIDGDLMLTERDEFLDLDWDMVRQDHTSVSFWFLFLMWRLVLYGAPMKLRIQSLFGMLWVLQ